MVNYKTLSFNYPLNKVKIVWNFKNRFDVYTIDNVGVESYLESITHYIKNKTIDNAQKICNKIVNFEIE